jgi:hypothetical protein
MANTNILIKRSELVGVPGSLLAGELAYSYASNTIFIGSPTGNGVVNVGGQYYTSQVDNATDAATGSTLVKRDVTGNASFNFITANIIGEIIGNANSATQLQTARDFSIDGDDVDSSIVSFDGTSNVILQGNLKTTGVAAGTYGGTTEIPVFTVDDRGRLSYAANVSVATTLEVDSDSGNSAIDLLTDTLTLAGGAGITTSASGDTITFDVDDTVVRSNTPITIQTIDGSLEINGNLTVLGTQTTVNTNTLNIADPLIYLASNNTSDVVDIGFAATYDDGTQRHTGVFRNAGNKEYYIFDNYDKDLSSNNEIDVADASFRVATLHANVISQSSQIDALQTTLITSSTGNVTIDDDLTVTGSTNFAGGISFSNLGDISANTISANNLSLTNALTVPNGGTGVTSFTSGQIIIGAGTNALQQIANSSVAAGQTYGSASSVAAFETDVYGRVVAVSNTSIAIDTSAITSGTLGYNRGGTGSTSYTTGALLVAGVSGFESVANTTYTQTGSFASNNTITSVTVDAYGRFTAATVAAIGGLTVGQGGTGQTSFTTNGIIYGNSSDGMLVTAAAGVADQSWSNQILTVTNAGVPVWSTALDGGQF